MNEDYDLSLGFDAHEMLSCRPLLSVFLRIHLARWFVFGF